jgi:lysophospholipid acyltransferase (LPLAT)-like uncharacterized protein
MSVADWLVTLVPPLGVGYLKLVRLTGRYHETGLENLRAARDERGAAIWAVWHNRLIGAITVHARKNIGAVISQSRDGELIARAVERLGYRPLRGSTTRGGSDALRGVLRHAREGNVVVFTPDGPKGPRYEVQQGVAFAAQRLGLPVLPLGVAARPKYVFKSWDRFQLPLPFSRVEIVYGPPLFFSRNDDVEEVRRSIREGLMAATLEADRILGTESP